MDLGDLNLEQNEIGMGNLDIPLIKPIRGVDYFTPTDIQAMVNEVFNRVNPSVQEAETVRQTNESTRQANETTRQNNETQRELVKAQLVNLITTVQEKLDNGDFIGEQGVSVTNVVVNSDYTLTVTLSDGTSYTSDSIRGEKGETGDQGNGISSIEKTGTSGNIDTYTITLDDGTTETFTVTNGKEIVSISKTGTSGLVDTYTITFNDNTTATFTVTNGNGIASIQKTLTVDNIDTYTITYTNGTTSTFTVTNADETAITDLQNLRIINTPEKATEHYLTDSADSEVVSIGLEGNSVQNSTTGKNKIPNELESGSLNGITYTVNNDGSIYLSGTATARVEPYLYNNDYVPVTLPAGTYKNTSSQYIILFADRYYTINANGGTLTIEEDIEVTQIYFRVENGVTVNEIFYPQIILNSVTDTSYEPYTGGEASPNPDYPQEIKNVESVEVTIENEDGTQAQTIQFPLLEGQKLMLGDRLEDDGIHNLWNEDTINGTTATFSDAKTNGAYYCDQKVSGNLTGQTITFDTAVTNAIVQYELAQEQIIPYTQEQQEAYNLIKKARTYKNITIITGEDEVKPYIDLTYVVDEETYIDEKTKDFVKNTDYASDSKAGLVRSGNAYKTIVESETGRIGAMVVPYSEYSNMYNNAFMSKGTFENAVEGKGLVKDTDYAGDSKGGTIRTNPGWGTAQSNGMLYALLKTYAEYQNASQYMFIGKGTIENLISAILARKDQNNNFSTAQTVNGTLTVNGDIVQNGQSYETHAEQLYTKKDLIKTRDGAVGGLGNNEVTGIEAELYDGVHNGRLVFMADGTARVGDVGDEVALLARDESANMTDGQVLVWDSTNLIAKGSSNYVPKTAFSYDAQTETLSITI